MPETIVKNNVSKAEIEAAREIDLLTFLQKYEPASFKKRGYNSNEYYLVEHDSLKISNGKWYWFSRGFGGHSALDFLIRVRGMDFVEAVRTLNDGCAALAHSARPINPAPKKPKVPFVLPKPNRCGFHAVAYLQNRGIDSDIILRCLDEGTFFESTNKHKCVFVGKDKKGTPRFACMRGYDDRIVKDDEGKEKLVKDMWDIDGSDKRYSFTVPTRDTRIGSVFVFESPIDALSHATLDKQYKVGSAWDCAGRLSLGGLSPLALTQYLKDHPDVKNVILCFDNDKSGHEAAAKIVAMLEQMPHPLYSKYNVRVAPPPTGKDYNDTLLSVNRARQPNQSRQKAEISI